MLNDNFLNFAVLIGVFFVSQSSCSFAVKDPTNFTSKTSDDPGRHRIEPSDPHQDEEPVSDPVSITGMGLVGACDEARIEQLEALVACGLRHQDRPGEKLSGFTWAYQWSSDVDVAKISIETIEGQKFPDIIYRIIAEDREALEQAIKAIQIEAVFEQSALQIAMYDSNAYDSLVDLIRKSPEAPSLDINSQPFSCNSRVDGALAVTAAYTICKCNATNGWVSVSDGASCLWSNNSISENASGGRNWSDGTYASSCKTYLNPTAPYVYSGETGDGVYTIKPGATEFNVYCDMTNGGWMLVMKNQNHNYADAMWTGTADINALDCLSTTVPNNSNCKIGLAYTQVTSWTTLKLVNISETGTGTIPKNAARTSLYDHLTNSKLPDSNINALMFGVLGNSAPGSPGMTPSWNDTSPYRTTAARISNDGNGTGVGSIGSYSAEIRGCGDAIVPDGNWRCFSATAQKIWWWVQ